MTAELVTLEPPVTLSDAVARWNSGAMALVPLAGAAAPLVMARDTRETLGEYANPNGVSGRDLIDAVEAAELRGRGGAGFPTGVKMRAVADREGPRTIVANGDEGEPLAVKDRYLMRIRPHLVLDGLLRVADAVAADRAVVYLSDTVSADSVRKALDELGGTPVPIDVLQVPRTYVGGEESSVVRAIDGGPPLPTDKPPRPFESGVGGGPTLVLNVETLARIPGIAAGVKTDSVLLTLTGSVTRPGLYEVPLGRPLRELVEPVGAPVGFLMGGYFAGLLGPRALDIPLGFTELRAEGSGLGCGAVSVLGPGDCPVAAAADVIAYFDRENARQCGPCIRGTAAMAGALRELADGTASDARLEKLQSWSASLRGRGACATLDGACNVAATLLREFPELVAEHRAVPCSRCAALGPTERTAPHIDPESEET
ncbi:NADH-ubiquinone oxidoreductase-F iron-sulfur binding region domain-containing protein [Saccharopolyspora pogona]|uniref:NADH-ubiquinone oxidoreductase-F iron-sulfur binding region domain-containing protein n=1 Tax=Saccharopolyspora pogona TaxID=333966 RepID=UPI0016858010|nr:NADH-ubiquinone oxidoreductase-F iron-sulfur binding region domain-containing protein [Saccharopolyspora pogona]